MSDASRVVARMLQTPLNRWRAWGARSSEVHVDDGVVWVPGREKALKLGWRVREDLKDHGFLIAEDKSS